MIKITPEKGDRVQWYQEGRYLRKNGMVLDIFDNKFAVQWDTGEWFLYNYDDPRIGVVLNGLEIAIRKAKHDEEL